MTQARFTAYADYLYWFQKAGQAQSSTDRTYCYNMAANAYQTYCKEA